MQDVVEMVKAIGDVPVSGLGAMIVLSGFGLAAYAIHAVLAATKGRR